MILESPDGGVIETHGSHPHLSHFFSEWWGVKSGDRDDGKLYMAQFLLHQPWSYEDTYISMVVLSHS